MTLVAYIRSSGIANSYKNEILSHFRVDPEWIVPTPTPTTERRKGKTTFHVIETMIQLLLYPSLQQPVPPRERPFEQHFLRELKQLAFALNIAIHIDHNSQNKISVIQNLPHFEL